MSTPVERLRDYPLGTRVVVRVAIDGRFADRLGFLTTIDETTCVIETRKGPAVVPLDDVFAAKEVPPAPPRRAPRTFRSKPHDDGP